MSSDWGAVAEAVNAAVRWQAVDARAALDDVLGANGGTLPRNDALVLAERTGWSVRQMYRWAAEAERPAVDSSLTFVERIDALGASEFVFDDLAITMLYLLGGNMARFREEVTAAGYPMPSLPTLSRLWRSTVSPHIRDGARHGQRNRHTNLFFTRHSATEPDEAWQLDEFDLDLRVLLEAPDGDDTDGSEYTVVEARGSKWVKVRPHLLLLIDDASRFITAWALLDHTATSEDTLTLFADGFEARGADDGSGVIIGGVPDRIVVDNASSFRSKLIEALLVSIGANLSPTPAYSPAAKGKVERAGQTIQSRIVTGLAGVVSAAERHSGAHALDVPASNWLTFDQVEAIAAAAVHRYNYEQVHSALGTTPFDVYSQRPGPRRTLADETLASMYQPVARGDGIRTLQPSGVQVFGEYWLSPLLDPALIGSKVTVKSLHHRLDRLALFSGDTFAGMVGRASAMTAEQRDELVDSRLDATRAVSRYAKRARQALNARTAAVAVDGDGSLLDAAATATAVPDTDVEQKPTRAERSGARPKKRPPSQRNDTSKVSGRATKTTKASHADREAALDEKRKKR